MNRIFHRIDTLFRLPVFAALGLAICLWGGTYAYTHSAETGSKYNGPHNVQEEQLWGGALNVPKYIGSKYNGPQNVQELMNALDVDYNNRLANIKVSISGKFTTGSKTTTYSSDLTISEIDARYPRAEWLQLLLDKGITINDSHEYASLLSKRYTLALLEDNPDLQQSGVLGIPPTDDWATYKAAYINKLVNDHVKIQEATKQIERSKEQVERAQKELKSQQLEHVRKQLEHAKKQLERAKKQSNPQQLKGAQTQLENAKKQLEDARIQLKEPTPPQEPAPPIRKRLQQLEDARTQLESAKKQLKHARKQLERAQEALEPPKAPTPPQEPAPPIRKRSLHPPL